MSDELKIANNCVVQFHYTLKTDDGDVLDTSDGVDPLTYLHGASMIVPGLESQMVDREVGDKFTVVVSPAEGYGEYQEPGPQPIPRSSFPEDAELHQGMSFPVEANTGERFTVWITEVQEDTIYVDANHPLAGKNLHFSIEVVSIRDATEDEIAHGHPHGPGGHHH